MSHCLVLKPSCMGCGSQSDLYGSSCRHMTICLKCGKTMAENKAKCLDCGTVLTRLIREYNVRAATPTDKNYFIGRFVSGLPNFKKGSSENKWSLRKDIPQGRQFTDAQREKLKNKPWILEDETGQFQYQGQLEGSQSATYYLLVMQNKEFVAIPAGSWYNFNKVAQYKQLTLEEAEEKMKNRRKTADGYNRWMMKGGNNDDKEAGGSSGGGGGGRGRKKSSGGEEEEGNVSDRGEEDEEEEAARKSRLGLNKKGNDDDDEEGPRGGDLDMDDDDIEKGDDWEHEEIFTDDDEAVGNGPDEREDLLAPEIPAPPEIKQDDEDEENGEEEGGLSNSGKELKKLLGKANGLNESEEEDDDDDSDDEEETNFNPVTNSKQKEAAKEEPVESTPPKPTPPSSSRGTPSAKPSKGKRKLNDGDSKKPSGSSVQKKVKTENETKPSVKEEKNNSVSKSKAPTKAVKAEPTPATASASASAATGPVTEDEIRAVLMEKKQVTTQDLVSRFKARLKTKEDKNAFADILRKISKIQKNAGSQNFVVLRGK
uniref:Transcription initiation factor IIF subunit alpha n=1 Tax=Brassica campestris TaxID=3711 RepID=M4C9A3_BRACM